jgi:hypothetical protein
MYLCESWRIQQKMLLKDSVESGQYNSIDVLVLLSCHVLNSAIILAKNAEPTCSVTGNVIGPFPLSKVIAHP